MLQVIFISILSILTFSSAHGACQDAPITAEIFQPLSGLYTGTLTYTNYGDNKLVSMPLLANMSIDDQSLNLNIEINEGGKRYPQNYAFTLKDGGIEGFEIQKNDVENGVLVLTNNGMDAERPATLRYTLMFNDEGMRITKEVKFTDDKKADYFIRNQYTFERMIAMKDAKPKYAEIEGEDFAKANVTIPGKQAFVLGEYESSRYSANLTNTANKHLEIAIYSKTTKERTGGFTLEARSKTKLKVGADQVIHIINPHKSKVLVRAQLTRQVEGMRYRDLD